MNAQSTLSRFCIAIALAAGIAQADPDKKIQPGDQMPEFSLQSDQGKEISNTIFSDRTTVFIYVIAKQQGSERAIADASKVINDMKGQPVNLVIVSGNPDHSEYFQEFWEEKKIQATLAVDPERALYGALGLIAFPTTLVVNTDGKLVHALSTHSSNYPYVLEGYIQHAVGQLDDSALQEHLKARSLPTSSPKSVASRHRAVARLMQGKGLYETAEKELIVALEYDEENHDTRLDLADLYLHLGRVSEAASYIGQVLSADPEHRRAMLLQGIMLFRQGNYPESRATLQRALVLNPDPARTLYYLGLVSEALGDIDQAVNYYRQSVGRLLNEPFE